jgi:hypothetical protein
MGLITVSGAKGKHVFAPTLATASSAEFDDDDGEEVELGSIVKGIGSGGEGSNLVVDHGADMDIDQGGDFVNETNVKQKYTTIKDDATSLTTDATGPPPSVSSTSLGPARKKTSLTSGSRLKQSSKSRTRTSSKLSTQASTAVAIHNMQGMLNRISDIFEKSAEDPASAKLDDAIQRLQNTNDGLTMDEKTSMVNQFLMKPTIANAYMALTDDALRVNWLRVMLAQIGDRQDNAN